MREIESLGELDLSTPFVVVEEDERYPDQLVFQVLEQEGFQREYSTYLSPYNVLVDTGLWNHFSKELEEAGYVVYALPSAVKVLEKHSLWSSPLKVESLSLTRHGEASDLFGYQQYGLQKALTSGDFFFFNYGTGTGKTVVALSGAQELFNRGEIDLCLTFTLRQVKGEFVSLAESSTNLVAKNIEGEPRKRVERYQKGDFDVLVMNYEKARESVDLNPLLDLVEGKRVLFVFDEVQKILNQNQAREGLDRLLASTQRSIVWPMSASIVQGDPERFWSVFEWAEGNPLGTLREFRERYVLWENTKTYMVRNRHGGRFPMTETHREYNIPALQEVRHRVSSISHAVRKTDPGVREYFKGLTFTPIPLTLSKEDMKVYEAIRSTVDEHDPISLIQTYNALRYTCLSLESHLHTENEISQALVTTLPQSTFTANSSVKMERMLDDIESLWSEGDKCIVFTHWTNLSLKIISAQMKKRGIPHTLHYGGQSDRQNRESRERFKTDPNIPVLLSSDAGSHGMNMPEARVVINYDVPYTYDTLMQRNDRIDRADSWQEGLEARVYYYQGTVEEKIWKRNNRSREVSSIVQGTLEELSREGGEVQEETPDINTLKSLIL